ncbi:unnamed protein product [Heligmosomoides polygyrus]|uniref:Reverse transcriptase domain-containing protein n=1 Tax=Heligmosomoides polygyrus TaxID=6339 RepID=A0A3P8B757_HELPZ|nr:unnamed protein product [Heligmosomoides polygyrus]
MDSLLLLCWVDALLVRGNGMFMHSWSHDQDSPFYNVVIDVKRVVRQGDTISPKLFSATLENVMRELEWEDMDISQAERMLADFDRGTNISECSSYVYLGREVNMANDLAPELSRRKRAAWGAFKSVEEVVRKTKNVRLRAHLSTPLFFEP